MNRLLSILVALVWGVWIGALVGVFIAVTSLDKTFQDRNLFAIAASGVFFIFERVQLALAAAALLLTFAWRFCRGAPGLKTSLFVLFAVCTVAAVVETAYVAPKIEELRLAGGTKTPEFRQMHGLSMALYSGTLLLLAIGGVLFTLGVSKQEAARDEGR